MDSDERDDRFFGIFGLCLAVAGILIPFIIYGFTQEDGASGGFLVVSLALSAVFGIIGRRSKPGIIAIVIAGAATVLILAISLVWSA